MIYNKQRIWELFYMHACEQLSGLKIDFHKNKLFCYGEAKEHMDKYWKSLDMEWVIFILYILVNNKDSEDVEECF